MFHDMSVTLCRCVNPRSLQVDEATCCREWKRRNNLRDVYRTLDESKNRPITLVVETAECWLWNGVNVSAQGDCLGQVSIHGLSGEMWRHRLWSLHICHWGGHVKTKVRKGYFRLLSALLAKHVWFKFHCFTVRFNSLYIMVQLMHLFVLKH
jgi:hypothetical protein